MSFNGRGTPNGPRRGGAQRIASGARAAPYSRPETSRMASSGSWYEENQGNASSKQWPPNQLTIRGASGPTWIIVANLLRGTTEADIHETFQQFGDIEEIKLRKAPSENHPSIAFEIAFTSRSAANVAVEKLDGALADGRLLQVALRDHSKFISAVQPAPSPVPALQSSPAVAVPAANKRELFPAIPSGPKAQQQQRTNSGRELLQPAQTQQAASRRAPVAAPSLQSRLMSAAELKALQRQQARTAAAARVVPGMPTGPKGTVATPASSHSMALAKRITLPLSMRLSEQAKQTGPTLSKKRKAKAKAKKANGMEVD